MRDIRYMINIKYMLHIKYMLQTKLIILYFIHVLSLSLNIKKQNVTYYKFSSPI